MFGLVLITGGLVWLLIYCGVQVMSGQPVRLQVLAGLLVGMLAAAILCAATMVAALLYVVR